MDEMNYKEMWNILKWVLGVSIKSDENSETATYYKQVLSLMEFNEEMQKEEE